MQTLHRARDRLIGARTALINQLRAILLERGITMPQGRRKLQRQLTLLLDEEGGLPISSRMMALVEDIGRNGPSSIAEPQTWTTKWCRARA
jgi:transposase